jgi:lipopolysaccharide assembly outer membrane protein LptD (OstA)
LISRRRTGRARRLAIGAWIAVLLGLAVAAPAMVAVEQPVESRTQDDPEPDDDQLPAPAFSDTVGQAALRWQVERPRRRASLYQAERTVYRIENGEQITYHYGNVYIDRDTVVVRADSAHVYDDRDLVRLFANVRVRHFDALVSSDWAEYRRDIGEADLRGQVRVFEDGVLATARRGELRDDLQLTRLFENAVAITPEYTVLADTLVRDRRQTVGEAFGNVRITDPGGGSLVTGDHALFASDGTWAEVDRNPRLETREEGGAPVLSESGVMTFYRAEERVVMVDSVRIRQGVLRAQADTAISYGKEHMVLLGEPVLEQGARSRMTGEIIEFFYRDGALYRVILLGDARMEDTSPDSLAAIYRGLPELDVIEGDSITVHFDDGEIRRTDVVGNAFSIYVPTDVEDEIAFNEVAGDTLVLHFERKKVRQVEVRGDMTGTYRFARIAAMRGEGAADSTLVAEGLAMADSLLPGADLSTIADLAAAALDSVAVPTADTLVAVVGDTVAAARLDTLATLGADSLVVAATDTLAAAGPDTFSFTDHKEDVRYSGDAVTFDMVDRTIAVSGQSRLEYGTMVLTARDVMLDTESRELYADGDPLLEDSETIAGRKMGYNFGAKTGAVRGGVTDFDGFYYTGDSIQRYPDGSLKICSGKMTSCDRPDPHFHFWADRMKMRLDDKVVAAPIVMHVGKVPVFALPFYFKSLKKGRRSGILFPSFNFGWSERDGRYIRDFGYYWATNDYTDLTLRIDYNERRELAWSLQNRYVKRYAFNGEIAYSNLRTIDDDSQTKEWRLNWTHSQPNLFDDYNVRARVEMASRELSRDDLNSDYQQDIVDGSLKSSITASRKLSFGNLSFSANRTEYPNAADDDPETDERVYDMTLPSVSVSVRDISLASPLGPGEDGSFLGNVARATKFSQGYSASSQRSATEELSTTEYNVRSNWGLTVRPDRFWIFNPNFSARSNWSWERFDRTGRAWVDSSTGYVDADLLEEDTRTTLTFSSGVTTKLYGVFAAPIGPLQAIRHTLGLSASANYRPQLGDDQDRSQSYSFGLTNALDLKYLSRSDEDTTATVKKLDNVLAWSLGTSYNPDSEKMWGQVSSRINIRPGSGRNLDFSLDNTIDPYTWSLQSTTFRYSFGLDARLDTGFLGQAEEEVRNERIAQLQDATVDTAAADTSAYDDQWDDFGDQRFDQGRDQRDRDRMGGGRDETDNGRFIPLSLSGTVSLNDRKGTDLTSRGSLRLTAQLTRKWAFNYTASINFREGSLDRQEWRLSRDLHCWRVEFMRTVSTRDSEFAFRFHLLSIPEIKLTSGRDNMLGTARGLSSGLGMGGF